MADYDVNINDTVVATDDFMSVGSFFRSLSDNLKSWDTNPRMLAYYKCDEGSGATLLDATGFRKNLTITGSPTWPASAGSFNFTNTLSIRWNGTSYATAADTSFPNFGTDDFTIALWVNCSTSQPVGVTLPQILDKLSGSTGFQLNTSTITGLMRFRIGFGTLSTTTSTTVFLNNTWKHLTIVKDSQYITMYVDGVQEVQTDHTTASSSNTVSCDNTQAFRIAANSAASNNQFVGNVDDLRIYGFALNQSQITDLAAKNLGYMPDPITGTIFGRSISDNVAMTDAFLYGFYYERLIQDNLICSDDLAVGAEFARLISDVIAMSDDFIRGSMRHLRTISDTVGVTDLAFIEKQFNIFIQDFLAVADTALTATQSTRSLSDTVKTTDALSVLGEYARLLSDSIAASEAVSSTTNSVRTISDNVALMESVTTIANMFRTISDNVALSESTLTIANSLRSVADTLIATDSVAAARSLLLFLQETIAVSDGTQQSTFFSRLLSDIATTTDAALTTTDSRRSVSDTVGATDGTTTVTDSRRSVSDTVGVPDTVSYSQQHCRAIADMLSLMDNQQISSFFNRTVTDTVSMSDNLLRISNSVRLLTDLVGSSDTVNNTLYGITRILYDAENYGLFETLCRPNDADSVSSKILEMNQGDARFLGIDFTCIIQGIEKGTFNFLNGSATCPAIANIDSFTVGNNDGNELFILGPFLFGDTGVFFVAALGVKDTEYPITVKVTDVLGAVHETKVLLICR